MYPTDLQNFSSLKGDTMKKRLEISIYGRVHGVSFRYHVAREANKLGITGSVKNTKDAVEIIAEGDEDTLKEFLEKCKEGPVYAQVSHTYEEWKKCANTFKEFKIEY